MVYYRRLDKLLTIFRLGFSNIFRVLFYRLKVKVKYYQLVMPVKSWPFPMKDCFVHTSAINKMASSDFDNFLAIVTPILDGNWCFYFYHWFNLGKIPSWLFCPFINTKLEPIQKHWSALPFFTSSGVDIKNIWELSRFYWAPQLALAYRLTGQVSYCERLNELIKHWCMSNPPQMGYQWMCGQETAIRLSNFLLAHHLMCSYKQNTSLVAIEFVRVHIKRILLTMNYAIGQDNNHAVSESAALYFAGAWLLKHDQSSIVLAKKAISKGKLWLENRVYHLIMDDGTFAQYSITYHRLMLDALSLCVWVQKKNNLSSFSKEFWRRYRSAFEWLYNIVDPVSGRAPNLGANDGAMFFKLESGDYRDFRPSLQLASVLLDHGKLYHLDTCDLLLRVFEIDYEEMLFRKKDFISKEFHNGGFVKFVSSKNWLLLRYSNFSFRPSQADVFHIDLWSDGRNILQDSGSYSYNLGCDNNVEFKGTAAHNTIQFDAREQMPLLSRFLWGSWLSTKILYDFKQKFIWCGEYQDYLGGKHRREVRQTENGYCITDWISGHKKQAILRWHVCSDEWRLKEKAWCLGKIKLFVFVDGYATVPVKNDSWGSFYYQQKINRPVFEIVVASTESKIETFIELG